MNSPELRAFEVLTQTYKSLFKFITPDIVQLDRIHSFPKAAVNFDIYSNLWGWAVGGLPEGVFFARRKGKLQALNGPTLVVIPPFSVVEWVIHPGAVEWTGYFTTAPYPARLPAEASAFRWNSLRTPASPAELMAAIENLGPAIPISRRANSSAVADRTKKFIDGNFTKNDSLAAVAASLRYSHSVMTRMFKDEYGISPLVYRNRLRIFEALRFMLFEDADVSSASRRVGFSSLSRFDKQFRNFTNSIPSNFKPTRGKKQLSLARPLP